MLGAQTILILAVSVVAACGGKAKKATSTTPNSSGASAHATPAAAATAPVSANVGASTDLAKQCQLALASAEKAPKFGYNDTELAPSDRSVLQQVADCMTKGPLKGKSVQLVGRADPRGTDEYNLGLGTRRAEHVRAYLQRLGVPATRLSQTTRGEIDATGSDEAGWQRDRRVDLELVN